MLTYFIIAGTSPIVTSIAAFGLGVAVCNAYSITPAVRTVSIGAMRTDTKQSTKEIPGMSTPSVNAPLGALMSITEGRGQLSTSERYREIHRLQSELRLALEHTEDADEHELLSPLVTAHPDRIGFCIGQIALAGSQGKKPARVR